jgi:hypothetical protein
MSAYLTPGWCWHKYTLDVADSVGGDPTVSALYHCFYVIKATKAQHGIYLREITDGGADIEAHVKSFPKGRFMSLIGGKKLFAYPTEPMARKAFVEQCEELAAMHRHRADGYEAGGKMLSEHIGNYIKSMDWYVRDA